MSPRWAGEHVVEGHLLFRVGRDGDDFVAEWPGLCELRSDRAGERVSFVACEGADEKIVAKVRGGLGAALVRHLRGETSLHACAFAIGDRALACLGPSGAGKSTLAAWFCRERGATLMADDIVRVGVEGEAAVAIPTERDHWLDASSRAALGLPPDAAEKTAIAAARIAETPARLAALVSLSYGDHAGVTIARVRGQRAVEALLPCLVRFIVDEPAAQIAEIERIEALLARAPLYELRAPRDHRALPVVADTLEALR